MVAALALAFIVLPGSAIARVLWKSNKPGERLFYTTMGLIVLGPIPFAVLWADHFTAFSIASMRGAPSIITFIVMVFVLPMVTAAIGEACKL